MQEKLSRSPENRLEGLCEPLHGARKSAQILIGSGCEGIERLEARFHRETFSPHHHDTYAIGITLAGIQTFQYRGATRYCLPGQCHVLHPDELHDGGPGTSEGFAYRIAYLDPALIQTALGGKPLPFVSTPVLELTDRQRNRIAAIWDLQNPIGEIERIDIVTAVADVLLSTCSDPLPRPLALRGLSRVRSLIAEDAAHRLPIGELERAADLDRWSLARQFRAAFGTSPSRFRTMRQLDQVRRLMRSGTSLADAALAAGFADQSHMARQFKRAYGLTPARWLTAIQ
jgi:AraC-like DNA-binding protein